MIIKKIFGLHFKINKSLYKIIEDTNSFCKFYNKNSNIEITLSENFMSIKDDFAMLTLKKYENTMFITFLGLNLDIQIVVFTEEIINLDKHFKFKQCEKYTDELYEFLCNSIIL